MHSREFLRLVLVIAALLLADHVIAADFRVLDFKAPSVPSGMQSWRVSLSYTANE